MKTLLHTLHHFALPPERLKSPNYRVRTQFLWFPRRAWAHFGASVKTWRWFTTASYSQIRVFATEHDVKWWSFLRFPRWRMVAWKD